MAKVQFLGKTKFGGQWYEGGKPVDIPEELYKQALEIGAFKIDGEVVEEKAKVQKPAKDVAEEEPKVEEPVLVKDEDFIQKFGPEVVEYKEEVEEVVPDMDMKKAELQALATQRGIEFEDSDTKAELIEKLK